MLNSAIRRDFRVHVVDGHLNSPLGHFASDHVASSAASEQTLLPCHLDTWIPRALYPVKIPSMHPLIGQSLGGREVT